MQRRVLVGLSAALVIAAVLVAYALFAPSSPSESARAAAPIADAATEPATPASTRESDAASAVRGAVETPAAEPVAQPVADAAPATTLIGRFVDRQGQPIGGVLVERLHSKLASSADSDALGRFELTLRVPESTDDSQTAANLSRLNLVATRAGYGKRDLKFKAALGATTDVGDLVLESGGTLSGRVVDEQGAGVPRALVRVPDSGARFPRRTTTARIRRSSRAPAMKPGCSV